VFVHRDVGAEAADLQKAPMWGSCRSAASAPTFSACWLSL
jgi:hypothetical protein